MHGGLFPSCTRPDHRLSGNRDRHGRAAAFGDSARRTGVRAGASANLRSRGRGPGRSRFHYRHRPGRSGYGWKRCDNRGMGVDASPLRRGDIQAAASGNQGRTHRPADDQAFGFRRREAFGQKTGRLVVVEEAPVTGNIGAEILAQFSEQVRRPVQTIRAAMPDMIYPYSSLMEKAILPDVKLIMAAVDTVIAGRATPALVNSP